MLEGGVERDRRENFVWRKRRLGDDCSDFGNERGCHGDGVGIEMDILRIAGNLIVGGELEKTEEEELHMPYRFL